MPKIKTNRSAAKRFSMTGSGKIRRRKMGKRHLLSSKTTQRKRRLRQSALVSHSDSGRIRTQIPNAL